MHSLLWTTAFLTACAVVHAASLNDVCTSSRVQTTLPAAGSFPGITIDPDSVVVNAVTNAAVVNQAMFPNAVFDYCNVSFAYSHDGRNDQVLLWYWLPTPENFQRRFLSTGGGGYAINSGNGSLPGGIIYGAAAGAAAGATDGGFGGFGTNSDVVILLANGTVIAIPCICSNFFNMSNPKLYTYYRGYSEGGRDGWSQLQRFGDLLDGAVTGAPAFRYGQQQVQHLYSGVVEQTPDYYPPPCELQKIANETITACDPLDGKSDGVVARTDLCQLHFNINTTIGMAYYCPANELGNTFPPAPPVARAERNSDSSRDGRRQCDPRWPARLPRPSRLFLLSAGGYFRGRTNGIRQYHRFLGSAAGGKIINYHGESDDSIPTASSVRYWESVRNIMYPGQSYNESAASLNEWYRLFLVPGAAHCSPNTLQPNGPFPQTNLAVLIDWVEKGTVPTTLNATYLGGENLGQNAQICAWPLRPVWTNNGTTMECQYEQASIDTWHYKMDTYKLPLY
ncbi:uncharacterized protein Z518_08665 [Rhinocladiella mackenziei CBS 650.93]|uniref:Carboxylic ester hydrolase n=1 Tax=Rhinocladiella mackenziei CBS 650.93 TaxID=1442369 RepID=A0A0D2GWX3_9EURO|nr:uncharacterized protein Z518_08665 [Rhinocladiella mackenziei CBS 650.93]KIX02723.1 hypothetical protein Z518_08665 [Rhinocladiella mackenziei CBS 650.93]